jgi:predicted MFS family arabinose efflux permease
VPETGPRDAGPGVRAAGVVLAAAFLFNLGQGALRPTLPLYLQRVFGANYRMVTLIPMVFGAGKWAASLPTGYLVDRLGGRPLMLSGLLLVAASDVASAAAVFYHRFLGLRALAGAGWAMVGTVATATMVGARGAERRGRAVSLLLMSETLGLLLGTAAGGWFYERAGLTSPFLVEAACMLIAALVVASGLGRPVRRGAMGHAAAGWHELASVLRVPGVFLMALTGAVLTAIQTGVLVFLFPLYLAEQGRLSAEAVGYVVSLGVLGRLGALWLGGSASDRWGRPTVLIPGLLGFGALLVGLTLVSRPVLLGLWSFLIGAGSGLVAGLPTAIVGDRVAPSQQGVAIGWLRTFADAGMLLGPLVLGGLADAVHLAAPFIFAGALVIGLAWCCHRR